MAYASPTAGSALNSPSHSLLHRQFDIDTSASEQSMVIDSSGNVGIGTASPLELLSLGTAGTTAGVLSLAGATSGKAIIDVSAEAGTPTLTLPTTTGTLALTSDSLPIGGGTLTGSLILVTGTTTVSPIKFIAGTNLTTPVAGVMEFDGTNLYFTV